MVLLIYVFNPRSNTLEINKETKFLFYVYGFILIISADWTIFINESFIINTIKKLI